MRETRRSTVTFPEVLCSKAFNNSYTQCRHRNLAARVTIYTVAPRLIQAPQLFRTAPPNQSHDHMISLYSHAQLWVFSDTHLIRVRIQQVKHLFIQDLQINDGIIIFIARTNESIADELEVTSGTLLNFIKNQKFQTNK